jgi:hypothetical protein
MQIIKEGSMLRSTTHLWSRKPYIFALTSSKWTIFNFLKKEGLFDKEPNESWKSGNI